MVKLLYSTGTALEMYDGTGSCYVELCVHIFIFIYLISLSTVWCTVARVCCASYLCVSLVPHVQFFKLFCPGTLNSKTEGA